MKKTLLFAILAILSATTYSQTTKSSEGDSVKQKKPFIVYNITTNSPYIHLVDDSTNTFNLGDRTSTEGFTRSFVSSNADYAGATPVQKESYFKFDSTFHIDPKNQQDIEMPEASMDKKMRAHLVDSYKAVKTKIKYRTEVGNTYTIYKDSSDRHFYVKGVRIVRINPVQKDIISTQVVYLPEPGLQLAKNGLLDETVLRKEINTKIETK